MVKINFGTLRTLIALSVTLAVAACQTPPGQPRLTNAPPEQKISAINTPPAVQDQPQDANADVDVARVYPSRPRLQTGMPPPVQPRLGARPPMLPSLEELLGRMPRTEDGSFSEPPPVPDLRGRRVAILLPLTGPNQQVGQALLSAAQMALFDFADENFELLVHDTHGTSEGASEAARLAIGDGASLIVGPLLSSSVRAVGIQARAASIPVMAFSSDRTVVGDGVYTMGFFPGDEVRRVVEFAAAKGASRFALLAPQDAYGETVLNALQTKVYELGAEVTQVQFYQPDATDFADPVKRLANFDQRHQDLLDQRTLLEQQGDEVATLALKRLENIQTIGEPPFDALLVADGGKRLVAVAAMLPFFDIDPGKVMILGTGQWDESGLGAEPALMGGWFAAPDPKLRQDFAAKYMDAFGTRPHRLATLAYDAMALAVVLGSQERAQVYDPGILTNPVGFSGRDGIFRFRANGAVERGLAVMKVQRKDAKVIDPAPQAFAN
jgi:outer membrane PBP1 activator LpoA protein